MRGVRGVGLVLVDERRRLVGVLAGAVGVGAVDGGPGQRHEPHLRRDGFVQRVVLGERHDDRPRPTLLHQVQAVVEELTEQREPRVEGRRQGLVGRLVRDEDPPRVRVRRRTRHGAGGRDGGRVADGLVDDEVADHPGLGVVDEPGRLLVAAAGGVLAHRGVTGLRGSSDRGRLALAEVLGEQPRERLVRRAVLALSRHEVVVRAVDGPEPPGQQRVRDARARGVGLALAEQVTVVLVRLADLDLLEDEPQVAFAHLERGVVVGDCCTRGGHRHHRERQSREGCAERTHRGLVWRSSRWTSGCCRSSTKSCLHVNLLAVPQPQLGASIPMRGAMAPRPRHRNVNGRSPGAKESSKTSGADMSGVCPMTDRRDLD